jgi:Domain of unknown function (DUF4412)
MTRALVTALCLAALPALAFEGVIETKMNATGPASAQGMSIAGNGKIYLKGLNSRMEQEMKLPGASGPMKQIVIHRSDEGVTYIVNDANRTYQKIGADKDEQPSGETSRWTVKKLGKETVAGRSTEHVQVSQQGKNPMELWVDTKLVSSGDLEKAFAAGDRRAGGWWKALKEAGVAGVPLKVVAKHEGESGMTWEATSVKAQSVSDSMFKVPEGYTEGRSAGMGPPQQQQQQQQMRDQMLQRLSPEQRKQVEEMMKQQGAGNQ